jgi:hypothetical protein
MPAMAEGIPLNEALEWQFPSAKHETARADMAYAEGVRRIEGPKRANIVKLTGPAVLTKGNTEYILEADVVADETAFTVKGSRITLNLNGHKVTYNNVSSKGCGVFQNDWSNPKDFVLINGEIEQGKGGGKGDAYGRGANPVFLLNIEPVKLAGLKITYSGDNLAGIFVYRGHPGDDIHHNELIDNGTVVKDRHSGVPAIRTNGKGIVIRHNVLRGVRQIGIRSEQSAEIHHNEIHIESEVTNSSGIVTSSGSIHHNKIIGRGVHPIGIWPGPGTAVYSNYVDVQNTKPGAEFGSTGAACVRFGWGKTWNVNIEDNLFIVRAEKGLFDNQYVLNKNPDSWGRALFVGLGPEKTALIRNNIIIGLNKGNGAKAAAVGLVFNNQSSGFLFEGNLIASNWGNLLLSDFYGRCEGYPLFTDNTIARLEGGGEYHTIWGQYATYPSTVRLLDNTYIGGASREDVDCDTSKAAVQEIVYCRKVVLRSSPAGGDGQYVASVVDQLGKAVWSAKGQRGTDLAVIIPDSLYTNRDGKAYQGSMEKKQPDGWGLRVQYMDKVIDLPLPAENVNTVDLTF